LNGGIVTAFLAALAAALWAYDGWEDLNLSAPKSQIRKRIFASVAGRRFAGGGDLSSLSAACLRVLPFDAVANSSHIASDVVEHIAGHGAAVLDGPWRW